MKRFCFAPLTWCHAKQSFTSKGKKHLQRVGVLRVTSVGWYNFLIGWAYLYSLHLRTWGNVSKAGRNRMRGSVRKEQRRRKRRLPGWRVVSLILKGHSGTFSMQMKPSVLSESQSDGMIERSTVFVFFFLKKISSWKEQGRIKNW